MRKTSKLFLVCGILALPLIGSSSARAFTIVDRSGQCLEDRGGDTTDGNPIVNRRCFGLFSQQWKWDGAFITGIETGAFPTCLTAFGSTAGTPVTLVACQAALGRLQQWIYIYPGQIVNLSLGLCLSVDNPTEGTQMTVRTCDPNNSNQLWSLRS